MKIEAQINPLIGATETPAGAADKYLLLRSGAGLLLVAMLIGLATGIEPIVPRHNFH